jgi:hypothetical protein
VTDEEVAASKLEAIIEGRGHRFQVECVRGEDAGTYVFKAWIGDRGQPSRVSRPRNVQKAMFDATSASAPLQGEVDGMVDRLCQDLSRVPDDPMDAQRFPKFAEVTGKKLADQTVGDRQGIKRADRG